MWALALCPKGRLVPSTRDGVAAQCRTAALKPAVECRSFTRTVAFTLWVIVSVAGTKLELCTTFLLPIFQVHRHIKAIPVRRYTYIIAAPLGLYSLARGMRIVSTQRIIELYETSHYPLLRLCVCLCLFVSLYGRVCAFNTRTLWPRRDLLRWLLMRLLLMVVGGDDDDDQRNSLIRTRVRAYSKRVFRTNCALRIKKCAPRIFSGIYFLSTS